MWKTPETSKEVNCAERSGRAVCISYYALTFHWGQFVVFGLIFNEAKKASQILGCKHLIKASQEHNTNVEQRGFFVFVFTEHKAPTLVLQYHGIIIKQTWLISPRFQDTFARTGSAETVCQCVRASVCRPDAVSCCSSCGSMRWQDTAALNNPTAPLCVIDEANFVN